MIACAYFLYRPFHPGICSRAQNANRLLSTAFSAVPFSTRKQSFYAFEGVLCSSYDQSPKDFPHAHIPPSAVSKPVVPGGTSLDNFYSCSYNSCICNFCVAYFAKQETNDMLKRIFSYMKPYRTYAILAIVCVALETMFELIIPLIMADIIDVGVKYGNNAYIFQKGGMMLACALLSLLLGIGGSRFAAECGQGLGAELRKAEYRKIQSFSFANTDRFHSSSLITRLTSDVTTIQNSISTGLRPA